MFAWKFVYSPLIMWYILILITTFSLYTSLIISLEKLCWLHCYQTLWCLSNGSSVIISLFLMPWLVLSLLFFLEQTYFVKNEIPEQTYTIGSMHDPLIQFFPFIILESKRSDSTDSIFLSKDRVKGRVESTWGKFCNY